MISSSGAVRANRRLPAGNYSQESLVTEHRDPLQVHVSWLFSSPALELNAALSPRGIGGSCLTLGICLRAAGMLGEWLLAMEVLLMLEHLQTKITETQTGVSWEGP